MYLSDDERCLEVTGVIDEVRLAVAKGIYYILELYKYDVTRYDS